MAVILSGPFPRFHLRLNRDPALSIRTFSRRAAIWPPTRPTPSARESPTALLQRYDQPDVAVARVGLGDTEQMSEPTGGGSGRPGSGLRGVLFDSGDVLMRPTSPSDAPAAQAWRRWFGGPRFVATVHAQLPGLRLDGADRAFDAGMRYLDQRHRQPLRTVAEERELFTDFYRIVLQALGVPDPPPALLQQLVQGGDDVGMEPFPEVVGVLHRLRDRGLRLGVLTENWPSVETAYRRLGLRGMFHAFVISAQEARLKDDPELFSIARARMGLPAEAILFVDDWPPHIQTALAAGFQGAVLDRNGDAPAVPGLTYLTDLHDVERLATSATLRSPPA
jgi:HAD superfamily hydrolase (TIGR01509 family)